MKKPFAKRLFDYRKRVFSQTIEDGIIEGIFENIGVTNKYFIEFGGRDGLCLSNTANLRVNHGWSGLLLEGNPEWSRDYSYVTTAFVTAENINSLFEQHNVPREYDLLSVDIDGNDYWVWKAINEQKFNARVVVVEYNCNFHDQKRSCAIKYTPEMDSTDPSIYYYGATIPAYHKLGLLKGYSLIYRVNLHNLFFVRTDLLHPDDIGIPVEYFLNYTGKAEPKIKYPIKNNYGYDQQLLDDIFQDSLCGHWNEYADTNIVVWWEQNFNREWVDV